MTNNSSSTKQRDVAIKPKNCDKSLHRSHQREKIGPDGRSHWKNWSNITNDLYEVGFESSSTPLRDHTKARAKHKQKTKRHDVDNNLINSMRNLSLGITSMPVARAVKKNPKRSLKFDVASYIRENLVVWTERVFAKIGPGQKEIKYHIPLKNLLLSKGLDVGYEVPLKFERFGSKPIVKRADLIVSMPGVPQKVLIECKAKKKIEKKDYEQVVFYQHHFGIPECYLVNFHFGTEVHRLKQRNEA